MVTKCTIGGHRLVLKAVIAVLMEVGVLRGIIKRSMKINLLLPLHYLNWSFGLFPYVLTSNKKFNITATCVRTSVTIKISAKSFVHFRKSYRNFRKLWTVVSTTYPNNIPHLRTRPPYIYTHTPRTQTTIRLLTPTHIFIYCTSKWNIIDRLSKNREVEEENTITFRLKCIVIA